MSGLPEIVESALRLRAGGKAAVLATVVQVAERNALVVRLASSSSMPPKSHGREAATEMIRVTKATLRRGIKRWPWTCDFHNDVYRQMSRERAQGLTADWWKQTLDRLRRWGATRPVKVSTIDKRVRRRLACLEEQYRHLQGSSLSDASWDDLQDLYELAESAKPLKSGRESVVFATKLCHFILPQVFVVVDRKFAPGISKSYAEHWQACHDAWCRAKQKRELQKLLQQAIDRGGGRMFREYPWKTKIVELCVIGTK